MKRDYTPQKPYILDGIDCSKCKCSNCDYEPCIHREAYRRLPVEVGGLGLCPRLRGYDNES